MNTKQILEKLKMTFSELVNNADAVAPAEVPAEALHLQKQCGHVYLWSCREGDEFRL